MLMGCTSTIVTNWFSSLKLAHGSQINSVFFNRCNLRLLGMPKVLRNNWLKILEGKVKAFWFHLMLILHHSFWDFHNFLHLWLVDSFVSVSVKKSKNHGVPGDTLNWYSSIILEMILEIMKVTSMMVMIIMIIIIMMKTIIMMLAMVTVT